MDAIFSMRMLAEKGPRVEPTQFHRGRRYRGCLRPRLAPLGRGDTGKKGCAKARDLSHHEGVEGPGGDPDGLDPMTTSSLASAGHTAGAT
eukprot:2154033-Pyramimonas_sp.AAC.1